MCKIYSYVPTEYFGSNMFLVESSGEYAVVDPSVSYEELISDFGGAVRKIKYVLVTHSHFDHFLAIDGYVNAGAEVIIGKDDAAGLMDSYINCYSLFCGVDKGYFGSYRAVDECDTLTLGNESVRIISTPGHTRGGISYLIESHLFVGDTVFADGNYGRCDLPGGNFSLLQASIRSILDLSHNITVYCGHGANTTIKKLKNYSW